LINVWICGTWLVLKAFPIGLGRVSITNTEKGQGKQCSGKGREAYRKTRKSKRYFWEGRFRAQDKVKGLSPAGTGTMKGLH
jgi:hypothetical protein